MLIADTSGSCGDWRAGLLPLQTLSRSDCELLDFANIRTQLHSFDISFTQYGSKRLFPVLLDLDNQL